METSRLQIDTNTLMKPDEGFVFFPLSQSVLYLGYLLTCCKVSLPREHTAPCSHLLVQLQFSMEQRPSCCQSTLMVMPQLLPGQGSGLSELSRPISAWQSYLPLSSLTYRAIQGQPGLAPKELGLSPEGLPHVSKICSCLW